MKYLLSVKSKLNNQIVLATQLLLLFLGAYVFIMADKHIFWKAPVIFIGLFIWFLGRDEEKIRITWVVLFLLLFIDILNSYFWVANHHFMLCFVVLALILYFYHKRTDILLKNLQMLLVIVIMASVFQKLTSSAFMTGNFYYDAINRGSLFRFFIDFFPETVEAINRNRESLTAYNDLDPNLAQKIVLKDIFPNLPMISLVYAWTTVILEFLVALAILWKPKSTWAHVLLIMLIFGILCARFETGFMGLIAICGLFLCGNLKLRFLYVLIIFTCIVFMITKLGYH